MEELKELFKGFTQQIESFLSNKKKVQEYCDSIVLDRENRILILRRTPMDDFMPGKWSLPGGKLEEGESLQQGALRELCEESNLVVNPFSSVGYLKTLKNNDGSKSHYFKFLLDSQEDSLNIVLDVNEHSEWKWIDWWEIDEYDFLFDLGSRIKQLLDVENSSKLPLVPVSEYKLTGFEIESLEDFLSKSNTILDDLLDSGEINDEKYLLLKAELDGMSNKDGSRGGKLVKVQRIDKNGKKTTKWVKPEEAQQERQKTSTEQSEQKKQSFDDNKLQDFAKQSSEEQLNNTIKNSGDEKLRQVAHQELDRRKKEEHIQEEKSGTKEEESNKEEGFKIGQEIYAWGRKFKISDLSLLESKSLIGVEDVSGRSMGNIPVEKIKLTKEVKNKVDTKKTISEKSSSEFKKTLTSFLKEYDRATKILKNSSSSDNNSFEQQVKIKKDTIEQQEWFNTIKKFIREFESDNGVTVKTGHNEIDSKLEKMNKNN